jgi:signal transduction histidine kinase/tetratricopeptide (TPR) repeat protein
MYCYCLVLWRSIFLKWKKIYRGAPTGMETNMVLKSLAFLFLLGSAHLLQAQDKLDSLTKRLSHEKNDSLRFEILLKLSRESEYYDYSKARRYAEEASDIAGEIGESWANAKLFSRLAFLEKIEGDYAEALKYNFQCIKLSTEIGDSVQLARAMNNVGTGYRDLGEYGEAYFYLTQSYRVAKNSHKVPTNDDSLIMAINLHNIGTVFTQIGQFDIALTHLQASAKLSEKLGDTEGPAYTFDELGVLYTKREDYELAERNLLKSLEEVRKLKIRILVPRIHAHIADLYLKKKDFTKALAYYDSVIREETKINNRFGLAESDLGKGMVMARSGNFDEALKLYMRSLEASRRLNARNLTLECYMELASLYEQKNDFQKSLQYFKLHDVLRDSVFSEANMEKLFQNQVRFVTENKDTEIEALSQARLEQSSEIKRQELISNILVIVFALTIILLFTVYRSGRRRKRINMLLLEHQEEIKKRSVELEQLNQVKDKFFSIISHDLRSPMNALAGTLDLLEQKNITHEEFVSLSKNLRVQFNHTRTLINNLLDWTLLQMDKLKIQPEKVVVYQKVEDSFVALKTLYPKDINMENRTDRNIVAYADPNIVNLVLRNLILNAIKFTEVGGRIWVASKDHENEIQISVSDNGIGIRAEVKEMLFEKTSGYSTRGTANEKGTGLGLILCKEFVEKNGGRIWLESEMGAGTTFYFTLPKSK